MDEPEEGRRRPEGPKQFALAFGIAFLVAFAWIIGFPWLLRALKAMAGAASRGP
jgi:hypothetical protein